MKQVFIAFIISALLLQFPSLHVVAQPTQEHNLKFSAIPVRWDSGIPLGNGMIGVLVWQKGDMLHLSLDRADLWDLRPTAEIEKFTYQWAYQHKLNGDWDTVWKVADEPYDRDPGPTKLPGASIEFDISKLGKVSSVELELRSAICIIRWQNDVTFRIFVDASHPVVRYSWTGTDINPCLVPPAYGKDNPADNSQLAGNDLRRLGYKSGKVRWKGHFAVYDQQAWGPLRYQAAIMTRNSEGVVSITSHYKDLPAAVSASKTVGKAINVSFDEAAGSHKEWWRNYWDQSSVSIPDPILEKQWYLEIYKFGSASRKGAPPVSLQAVWTADDGKLPPWKGDFHSDLNTQLSYWPAYSSNHLEEASVFTDWLWMNKSYFENYAKRVFGTQGLNVPGVATLRGHEMGGWHMYAMSPTIACWLAQHFYLQWRYSMDTVFLTERAYPWISAVASHIEQLAVPAEGRRQLPMSSSPEFNDGGIKAWFLEMTNYDRALCRYIFVIAAELSDATGNNEEAAHWREILEQLPYFDIDPQTGLTVAPGFPYNESHRHFSHVMAFHPLGLLSFDNGQDRDVIEKSINNIVKYGAGNWCGYSYSWLGSIYARMKMGDQAQDALKKFASCYCSPNSFHLNNDQCKSAGQPYSGPFTLEGNFAFAAGIQEMLLQSHAGYLEIMPAIGEWKDVTFKNLRTEGAFLVSATRENGVPLRFSILSEKGGKCLVKLPFKTFVKKHANGCRIVSVDKEFISLEFEKGGTIVIENGYE